VGNQIKIEVSRVLRGKVWPIEIREVVRKVEDLFSHAEMRATASRSVLPWSP